MPDSVEPPPPEVTAELAALSAALDRVVPAKTSTNLLVATWNIRAFDRYTPTWRSAAGDSPIRDYSNIAHIAEIVSRFDVIAIQELRRSATAFLAMLDRLGPDWAFLTSDVTEGDLGNMMVRRVSLVPSTSARPAPRPRGRLTRIGPYRALPRRPGHRSGHKRGAPAARPPAYQCHPVESVKRRFTGDPGLSAAAWSTQGGSSRWRASAGRFRVWSAGASARYRCPHPTATLRAPAALAASRSVGASPR
jgi:hypothetical protein